MINITAHTVLLTPAEMAISEAFDDALDGGPGMYAALRAVSSVMPVEAGLARWLVGV